MRAQVAIGWRAGPGSIWRDPGEAYCTPASADDRPGSMVLRGVVSVAWRRPLQCEGLARMALSISARFRDPVRAAGASVAGTAAGPCARRTADERQHALGLRGARRQLLRAPSRQLAILCNRRGLVRGERVFRILF